MAGSKNLTRLNVALTATTGAFASALKGAEWIAQRFGDRLKSAILSPVSLITGALTTGALIAGVKNAARHIDELAKSADRLGISTQSLAGLQHAADLSGVSAETLTTSFTKLEQKVGQLAAGSHEAEAAFKQIGIRFADLAGLSPDQQFAKVAAGINGLGTAATRTAATLAIFGKGGAPLLNLFGENLADARAEAEALGLAISRVDAAKVEQANDALTNVGAVFQGIFNRLAVELAPLITAIAQAFTQSAIEANGFQDAIRSLVDFAISAAGFVGNAWQGLGIIWKSLEVGSMRIAAGIVDLGNDAVMVAQAIGAKFQAAWDLNVAATNVMVGAVSVAWSALKVPVADFTQFVGRNLAEMLQAASSAIRRLKPEMADALDVAAGQISTSTGTMGADARKSLEAQTAALKSSAADVAAATAALFAPVVADGSAALSALSAQYDAQAQKLNGQLAQNLTQAPASAAVQEAADKARAVAEVTAEARAADVTAAQEHANALAGVEAEGLKTREELNREYWDNLTGMTERQRQQAVSGTSAMFANLATLQQSHNKKARAIGKAAAKAKIITDTASAAMGAYSAMASIPYVGPALGVLAAAAAVAAGAIQLSQVDRADSGSMSGSKPADTSTSNLGGIAAPNSGQTLVLQGDNFSAESLMKIFDEAKERGFSIDGVRRG